MFQCGEDRSINHVTDAGHWTPETGHMILYSVQCYALHWTANNGDVCI